MNDKQKSISLGEVADKLGIFARPVSLLDIAEKINFATRPIDLFELDEAADRYLAQQDKK